MDRAELRAFFSSLPLILSGFIPALTMRLFAEEKRAGSIETLMTLPVTEVDVVTGKYLASFLGTLIMIAPTLLYILPAEIFV
jgi:ABC-2 type transport system permease protein